MGIYTIPRQKQTSWVGRLLNTFNKQLKKQVLNYPKTLLGY